MTTQIKASKNIFEIYVGAPKDNDVVRSVPAQRFYDVNKQCWQVVPNPTVLKFLVANFPGANWSQEAIDLAGSMERTQRERELAIISKTTDDFTLDYEFKTTPYEHQRRALYVSHRLKNFGLFMEMGTGKSKVVIDNGVLLFETGEITGVLVICPNSVKKNWANDELEKHIPERITWRSAVWNGGYKKDELSDIEWLMQAPPGHSLPWLIINYEAAITEKGSAVIARFLRRFTCMIIADESQKIKNPKAQRTKQLVKMARLAKYRRILTGTPITNNPMDLYSQFYFLDQAILGHPSFFTFRQRYAVMGGFEGRQIIAYKHLDELEDLVRGHSFRVRKADCLDLPPRVYEIRRVSLTDEQRHAYKQIKDQTMVELKGEKITASIMLTKLLRFQQLIGGAIPSVDGNLVFFNPNPRLNELLDTIADLDGKVVIWSRFQHEVQLIDKKLAELYGPESVVKFYGGVDIDNRQKANAKFQQDPKCRFFVGTPATGGVGVNLSAASTEIFYSNDFDMGNRMQAEERLDRADELTRQRYERGESTTVIDLVAEGTVDSKIVKALRGKKKLADIVVSESFFDESKEESDE